MDNDNEEIDDLLRAGEITNHKAELPDEELEIPIEIPEILPEEYPEILPENYFQSATQSSPQAAKQKENHSFFQAPLGPDSNWECKHCQKKADRICPNCQGSYCLGCASFIDQHFCKLCLSEGTIEVQTEDLVGKDGVHHKGRRLVPIGEAYKTMPKIVSEMSDLELETHISKYKMLAHKHGLAKTFCEVNATLGEFEQSGREHIKRKKRSATSSQNITQTASGKVVGTAKQARPGNGASSINIPSKIETKSQATNVANILKNSGISLAQLEELVALKKKLEGK